MKQNMNVNDFDGLSMHNKMLLVDDFAIELCSIEHYDHRIFLYALNDLLIESYHNIDTRQIDRITIAKYNDLDKFLTRIRLQSYRHPANAE